MLRSLSDLLSQAHFNVDASNWGVLYLRRVGSIKIGMSVASIRRILGERRARLSGNEPYVPLNNCAYLSSKALPKGLGLMFANYPLVRIDVSEGPTRNKSGIGIGDAEEKVKHV